MASLNTQQAGRDAADFDNRRKEDPTWADRFREMAREEVLDPAEIARREEIAAVAAEVTLKIDRMMDRVRADSRAEKALQFKAAA